MGNVLLANWVFFILRLSDLNFDFWFVSSNSIASSIISFIISFRYSTIPLPRPSVALSFLFDILDEKTHAPRDASLTCSERSQLKISL